MAAERTKNLGRTQKLILRLLANGQKSIRTLAMDWPDLTESAAYSAIERLATRGLVDRTGFKEGAYVYGLTQRGREAEAAITGIDLDAEEEPTNASH